LSTLLKSDLDDLDGLGSVIDIGHEAKLGELHEKYTLRKLEQQNQ